MRAYHQIPVDPSDVHKMAVTAPFGLFEFLKMPFGLHNVAQTFQRFMDQVLHGVSVAYSQFSLPAVIQSNISRTYKLSLSVSPHMVLLSTPTSASLVSLSWIFSDAGLTKMVSPRFLKKFRSFMIFLNQSLLDSCVGLLV